MSDLIRYDAMCTAIAQCYEVDEVKDIRDKAMAMQAYAKQALNLDAEKKAAEIRIRAERKTGQLMQEMKRGRGARTDLTSGQREPKSRSTVQRRPPKSEFAQAKQSAGISDTQAKRWQKLAQVPDDDFENAMASPAIPSTTSILKSQKPNPLAGQKPIDERVIRLLGWLREFEENPAFKADKEFLLNGMTDGMLARFKRHVPSVVHYFNEFGELLNEK